MSTKELSRRNLRSRILCFLLFLVADVWRSGLSFDDFTAVGQICGVKIPACGPGLTCLPTDPSFSRMADGSVSCAALRQCANTPVPPSSVIFTLACSAAPWSARSTMQVEMMGRATTFTNTQGQTVSVGPGSLIMQGNSNLKENDVWLSSDKGVTWHLIAGVSQLGDHGVQAAHSPYDQTSFTPDASFGGFTVDNSFNIYRIGGAVEGGACANSVWMSTDGKTWTNQVTSASTTFSPLRDETIAVADNQNRLYLIGGRRCGDKANLNGQSTSSHYSTYIIITSSDTFCIRFPLHSPFTSRRAVTSQ